MRYAMLRHQVDPAADACERALGERLHVDGEVDAVRLQERVEFVEGRRQTAPEHCGHPGSTHRETMIWGSHRCRNTQKLRKRGDRAVGEAAVARTDVQH